MNQIVLGPEEQSIVNSKTILLVEDDCNDALMTQRALRKANMLNRVVWARDGVEAIDHLFTSCLEQGEELPQLILLDIHMPRLNGIEVLTRIRGDERLAWIPVVIFTSSKEEKDLINSYRLGLNSYICKPINFEVFATVVASVGCYWLLVNQGPPVGSK
jgi:two-component system, response regulator